MEWERRGSSGESIDPTLRSDLLNGAFASNLNELVLSSGALLWVHGHTHYWVDYSIGNTRVMCNPRGYAGEDVRGFDPNLVIDV